MKESDTVREHRVGTPVNVKLITVVAGVVVLLSPMVITWASSYLDIHAMAWWIEFRLNGMVIGFNHLLSAFPFTASRLFFIRQVYRYYSYRSTRATTVLVGFAVELPMGVVGSFFLLTGGPALMAIPIPFLAIFAIAIMWKLPYSEAQTPW